MARVTQNSARLQPMQRTSHTRTQHTNTQAPHACTTSHTAPTTAHCANTTHAHRCAHATHSSAHSSDHPTHRPQKIAPSHARCLRGTLTSELSGCPPSTGCCRRFGCRTCPATCRTHEQPSRHTMATNADAIHTTAHRYLTPSSHSTTPRHGDGRARHNATHSDTMHVQTSARHTTTTKQLQTASECREWHTRKTATRRRLTAET
jgi:hypothetical protein